jgi:hypothetical protein
MQNLFVKEVLASGLVDQDAPPLYELNIIFGNIIPLALGIAGIVLFIMLLLGGFKYMTSGGNPKAAESARNTLTYAIAGLILISAAYFIILFIKEYTGIGAVLNFNVYR